MRTLRMSAILIGMVLICACTDQKPSSVQTYLITWENMDSFEDAPGFADRKIDKRTSRFLKPNKPAGDPHYFPEGTIQVPLPIEARTEAAARIIGEAIAATLFENFKVMTVQPTRFGYYVFVDWGVSEEGYTGHVLYLMIDLDDRIVWWSKCD